MYVDARDNYSETELKTERVFVRSGSLMPREVAGRPGKAASNSRLLPGVIYEWLCTCQTPLTYIILVREQFYIEELRMESLLPNNWIRRTATRDAAKERGDMDRVVQHRCCDLPGMDPGQPQIEASSDKICSARIPPSSSVCSAQGQVLHCKCRNQGCSFIRDE